MNMILLTGLSVALALSMMTTNNFYANKVTNASIKDADKQIEMTMSNVMGRGMMNFNKGVENTGNKGRCMTDIYNSNGC